MSNMTRYLQKKLLDHTLGTASFTLPTTWLALFTTDPGEDGDQTGEVGAGIGYSRQPLTASMAATTLATGRATNAAILSFGPATGDWGPVGYFGVCDAVSAGTVLIYAPIATPMIIASGDAPPVSAGDLEIAFA